MEDANNRNYGGPGEIMEYIYTPMCGQMVGSVDHAMRLSRGGKLTNKVLDGAEF